MDPEQGEPIITNGHSTVIHDQPTLESTIDHVCK